MSLKSLNRVKAEAAGLGFSACGASPAGPVDEATADAFRRWIADGNHASMAYMAANTDKRLDPRLLMGGVKTIVSVALNYAPPSYPLSAVRLPSSDSCHPSHQTYTFAAYALGKDYHDVMRTKLHRLAAAIGATAYRAFCDTAPVLERYWAERSGIGWVGRNRQLIVPRAGSMFFLGELFLTEELDDYDSPMPSRCGTCTACLSACPTAALVPTAPHSSLSAVRPSSATRFDARRCLSYHTIESREEIPADIASKMGRCIYGCDRCQEACPHNRFAVPSSEPDLQPNPHLLAMTDADWRNLDVETYRRIFKGSAVKRAKYEGLMRNISAVSPND